MLVTAAWTRMIFLTEKDCLPNNIWNLQRGRGSRRSLWTQLLNQLLSPLLENRENVDLQESQDHLVFRDPREMLEEMV
jgi:hypothetical protein